MATSTIGFAPQDFKKLIDSINQAVEDGTKQAAHTLWSAFLSSLSAHWLLFLILLFIVFIAATFKAMMGRWGSLGSFLYNFFYFGTLFIIGLIWGPEIFVNDFFNAACAVILYPICFILVGYILKKTGVRMR